MLDIRATHYVTPLSEVDFAPVTLTVRLMNMADETGLVTGMFRVYNASTGLLIHTSDIVPVSMPAGATVDASALTNWDPPGPAVDTYFVMFDGIATNALVPDGIGIHLSKFVFDVKPAPLGPVPAGHAVTHEDTGVDEIDVTDLSGLLADAQTPILHHLEHETGGADEVNVAGLSGELADDQPPKAHGNAAHTSVFEDQANKGAAGGYCGLPNPLDSTLPLRADGTPGRPVGIFYENDILAALTPSTAPWVAAAIAGGSFVFSPFFNGPDHPGCARFLAVAGAGSGARLTTAQYPLLMAGGEKSDIIFRLNTTVGVQARLGFLNTLSGTAPLDGIFCEIQQVAGVDATLVGKSSAAGVSSTTATSYVLAISTWYRCVIDLNPAANLATYTILDMAGATLWTDTTNSNLPLTISVNETGHGVVAVKPAGGSGTILEVDYIALSIARALTR